MRIGRLADHLKTGAAARAPWLPVVHRPLPDEQRRREAILLHAVGRRWPKVPAAFVPDAAPDAEDVAIAKRLLAAFRAQTEGGDDQAGSEDVWTLIAAQQKGFASLLRRGTPEGLAAYLCNVSRHDASIGIVQGDAEYARLRGDPYYRRFVAMMAKDKLVSLAEALAAIPIENPEQSRLGAALEIPIDELVSAISQRLGLDIAPPPIDHGLFKLVSTGGLFGERDANAIFTAWLIGNLEAEPRISSICEIGGGSGRVAYWCQRFNRTAYTLIDLPHVNVVQGYYLLKTLPPDRVRLYGEAPLADADAPSVTVWPHHALDELPDESFDLVVNQDSMPEMAPAIVAAYLDWIVRVRASLFVSINHESKHAYAAGLAHVSVPEAAAANGRLTVRDRYPYWLRKGYVVTTYGVRPS